jgi:TetR/AcrR family fatty acid metabolism transcriptional regulator
LRLVYLAITWNVLPFILHGGPPMKGCSTTRAALTEIGRQSYYLAVRSENVSSGQGERSFIERARRAQIVECAIDAIAELGYAKASLAEIARRAGVSKGVISYHFEGRRELVEQVVKAVLEKATAVMRPRIIAEHSVAGMLRAYLTTNLEFLGAHPNYVHALLNIAAGARDEDGKAIFEFASVFEGAVRGLEKLLRRGQERGEFREFSTRAMAVAIRNAIDGLASRLNVDPKLDLKSYANELATAFDLATRRS